MNINVGASHLETQSNQIKNTADMVLVAMVIEAGSISSASHITGLDRSSLGRRLAALEDRIGVALFDRSSQKIRLTDAGFDYFQYCRRVREMAEEAELLVAGKSALESSGLSILVDFEEAGSLLAPIIRDFKRAYEEVELSVTIVPRLPDSFPDDTDLVLRIDAPRQPGFKYHELSPVPRSMWANKDYLAATKFDGSPHSIAELTGIGIADASNGAQTVRLLSGTDSVDVPVMNSFRLPTLAACRDACSAKVGIALLPDYLCLGDEQKGLLTRASPGWRPAAQRLVAVHRTGVQGTRRTMSFVEFCQERSSEKRPVRELVT